MSFTAGNIYGKYKHTHSVGDLVAQINYLYYGASESTGVAIKPKYTNHKWKPDWFVGSTIFSGLRGRRCRIWCRNYWQFRRCKYIATLYLLAFLEEG